MHPITKLNITQLTTDAARLCCRRRCTRRRRKCSTSSRGLLGRSGCPRVKDRSQPVRDLKSMRFRIHSACKPTARLDNALGGVPSLDFIRHSHAEFKQRYLNASSPCTDDGTAHSAFVVCSNGFPPLDFRQGRHTTTARARLRRLCSSGDQ